MFGVAGERLARNHGYRAVSKQTEMKMKDLTCLYLSCFTRQLCSCCYNILILIAVCLNGPYILVGKYLTTDGYPLECTIFKRLLIFGNVG